MVVKHGQDIDPAQISERIQEAPIERDNANFATSFFIPDVRMPVVDSRPSEFFNSCNDVESTQLRKPGLGYPTEFTDGVQKNHIILPAYANISVHEGTNMTDHHHRQTIVIRRTGSIDSTDGNFSPRNSMKHQNEYECMSSPDSASNSSSNRSSNTGSCYGNISPDTLSLASFAGRLNFGRFGGSKRSSQSSNASSQDSGRQSWGKIRDSFDLSDTGASYYVRRASGEQVYENTRPFTPENFMRFSRIDADHMDATDGQLDESPPPLPSRQNQPVSTATTEEPEMILPYKVVDLDELQRSLADIEPYYIHDGSEEVDSDFYNECSDPIEKDIELDCDVRDGDFRPVLPPKKNTLTHSHSDSCCNSTKSVDLPKERPTPLPRQSLIINDFAHVYIHDGTVQNTQTDETTKERPMSGTSHLPRQTSLPNGPVSKTRRHSTSPHSTSRPMRSAPPPPPPRALSPGEKAPSSRPVSEMFPRTHTGKPNSPVSLKRSMTISVLQSPFSRRPVESLCKESTGGENSAKIPNIPPTTLSSGEPVNEKNKEDTGKAGTSKTGVFFGKSNVFKKALSTLKIPGTKKAVKKELAISPPTDFTSLYQTRFTTDYSNREQKTVSFLETDNNGGEIEDSDTSTVTCESVKEVAKSTNDESEVTAEGTENPIDRLTFHPEFTGQPTGNLNQPDEQFYYNFPITQGCVNGTEKVLFPKKPPRSGYLQPSLSQRTVEREEEISLNKLPQLGPLPTPPEGSSSSGTPSVSLATTPESDAPNDKDASCLVTPENHLSSVTTTAADDQKAKCGKSDKPFIKPKPEVPRRPDTLKLKPKKPNRLPNQFCDKPTPIPRSLKLDTAIIQKSRESMDRNKERRHSTPLEESAGMSRSCDFLDVDDPRDNYLIDMHLIALKDILRCWRNMLRKPSISLAGACWEDFEMVESESWPKVSEDQCSVSLPVQLKKSSTSLDSNNCCGQYIAKIKCQTQGNSSTKSLFDQDYSVCSSVESHENVSRVLAYFRGDIRSPLLGIGDELSPLHTTISISDQVPVQTCAEFVAQSKGVHSKDPFSYERTVCMLILQCLKGVTHLHDSGFAHGNLNLNNLFLIKHNHDFQLLIGNFGKSQPLAEEQRVSNVYTNIEDSLSGLQNDLTAISEILAAMLHEDQNGNGSHASKTGYSALSEYLRKASERLKDGSASTQQVVCFLQALLWGPFRLGENIVIVSESRMKRWLDRQRGEFIARLAMDEALARTVGDNSRKFSMEDLLLCEYLTVSTPSKLVRTEKCWFLAN